MITRGTTPYHSFILPLAASDIQEIYVTYLQNDEVILDKGKNDVDITDLDMDTDNASMENLEENEGAFSTVGIHLTQEDTLKFHFYPAAIKNIAVIQIRVLDSNGEAYASDPIKERIFGVLKDGVIENETASN